MLQICISIRVYKYVYVHMHIYGCLHIMYVCLHKKSRWICQLLILYIPEKQKCREWGRNKLLVQTNLQIIHTHKIKPLFFLICMYAYLRMCICVVSVHAKFTCSSQRTPFTVGSHLYVGSRGWLKLVGLPCLGLYSLSHLSYHKLFFLK